MSAEFHILLLSALLLTSFPFAVDSGLRPKEICKVNLPEEPAGCLLWSAWYVPETGLLIAYSYSKTLLTHSLLRIGYFFFGYAFAYGDSQSCDANGDCTDTENGFIGTNYFALKDFDSNLYQVWYFQYVVGFCGPRQAELTPDGYTLTLRLACSLRFLQQPL